MEKHFNCLFLVTEFRVSAADGIMSLLEDALHCFLKAYTLCLDKSSQDLLSPDTLNSAGLPTV